MAGGLKCGLIIAVCVRLRLCSGCPETKVLSDLSGWFLALHVLCCWLLCGFAPDPCVCVCVCGVCRYETFELRIIHRRRRTGFEDSKEFPIRKNDLIAGRYQVRWKGSSPCRHGTIL